MQMNNNSLANRLSKIDYKEYQKYINERFLEFIPKSETNNPIEKIKQLQETLKV